MGLKVMVTITTTIITTINFYGPVLHMHYLFYFLDFIYLFLERGVRREKENERNIRVREKH